MPEWIEGLHPAVLIAALIAVSLLVAVFVHAYITGREFSFWHLKIGRHTTKKSMARESEAGRSGAEEVQDEAHALLQKLGAKLDRSESSYFSINEETVENFDTASQLFQNASGQVIATCFFEKPDYGESDFAQHIRAGTKFVRITRREVCPPTTERKVRQRFETLRAPSTLVVLPKKVVVSLISGIFCKLPDKSYLAFLSLTTKKDNAGIVLCGGVAREMYRYFLRYTKDLGNETAA